MSSQEMSYDLIFKTVLIGDSGVGKSNIFLRYVKNYFDAMSKPTVGVEFGSKEMVIENSHIKAQIWDTAGQERYRSITKAYYKGAKGALLLFDVTNRDSFNSVDRWIEEIKNESDPKIVLILIGNKVDLDEKRKVTCEEGIAKAELYSKCSIKLNK